ncbi:MAG: hypothetical protein RIB30_12945 [Thalassospira sp.]|uniref:hypothetical protein n=1 Tax=Thalassospira sp. TaxID=1912094 RepID=UPI0032EFA3C0
MSETVLITPNHISQTIDRLRVRLWKRRTGWGLALMSGLLAMSIPLGAAAQNANLNATPDAGDIAVFTDEYDGAEFCANGIGDQPCAVLPVDVPEFDASFVYRFLAYHAQRPFDRFSWQAFTALMASTDASDNAALWETFPTRRDVLSAVTYPNAACRDGLPNGHLLLASYVQSSGDVLVDQAGNFVLFEARINPVARDYILSKGLETKDGRAAFAKSGAAIDFPIGHMDRVADLAQPVLVANGDDDAGTKPAAPAIPLSAPGVMGAQLLKFAWRILPDDPDDNAQDVGTGRAYYTRPARISLGIDQTLDGQPKCLDVTVGLVGLHIVQRVASGNGDRWIWSSFEHVDNVPLAANARRPNSIITDDPFADGCLAPDETDQAYAFYGGGTAKGGAANQSIAGDIRWADTRPFARPVSGGALVPPDIVRCWRLFSGTAETNFVWQNKLAGTVWQNYMLLGTQWIGNPGGAPFGVGEVPRYLTNSALESFMQHQSDATCLGCHSRASTDAGQPANLTFLLDPAS